MITYAQLLSEVKPKTAKEVGRLLPYMVRAAIEAPEYRPDLTLEGTELLVSARAGFPLAYACRIEYQSEPPNAGA